MYTNYFTNNGNSYTVQTCKKRLADGNNKNFTIQSDFVKPFTKIMKLETGVERSYTQQDK